MAEDTESQTGVADPPKEDPAAPEVKTLTQEDINKLIEGARKQEKDKLYGTIDELKNQIAELSTGQKEEKEAKEKAEKEAKEKQEAEATAKLSIEEQMAKQFKKLEEQLAKEAEERERLKQELDREREAAAIEKYKNEVLASAGDKLVRELVNGNSKAEIDASVEVAKQKYQQYFDAAVQNAEGDPKRKVQDAGAKMPSPSDPDPDPVDEEGLRGLIPNIDPMQSGSGKPNADYVKNRDEILSRVSNMYKSSAQR